MTTHIPRTQPGKTQIAEIDVSQKYGIGEMALEYEDNRAVTIANRKVKSLADNSQQALQLKAYGEMANHKTSQAIQSKENKTGLPDKLKAGVENLSGYSMDDVKVHYNSSKPAQLEAHAYAQGTDIHIASGQEKHLPHEAWHVVQQKQGRVKPTMQVKALQVNDNSCLEKEADIMGVKALSVNRKVTQCAGVNAFGKDMELKTQYSPKTEPVLQARWLINHERREFYWEPEQEVLESEPPNSLSHLRHEQWPEKYQKGFPYQVNHGTRGRGDLLYSADHYLKAYPQGSGKSSGDVYNPFGRFKSGITSFIPSAMMEKTAQEAFIANLKKNDKTFRERGSIPSDAISMGNGYPSKITEKNGMILHFVDENNFGAIYEENPDKPVNAVANPSNVAEISRLAKLPPSFGDVRFVINENLTADEIRAWSGRDRSVDQGVVMGASAGDAAQNAGFDRNEGAGWEWLHLIAHSMGGIAVQGPQVAKNLVAGTSECNTQMIIVEEFLKDFVLRKHGHAKLMVFAQMYDEHRHIGLTISYDFEFYNNQNQVIDVYHWQFNALSRRQPMVMENRSLRNASREHYPDGGGRAKTLHIPRSEPTAHGPSYFGVVSQFDQLIDAIPTEMTNQSPDIFITNLIHKRNINGGTLNIMVYNAIGDHLTFDTVSEYVQLLNQRLPEKICERVLSSFIENQKDIWRLNCLFREFNEKAAPEKLKQIILFRIQTIEQQQRSQSPQLSGGFGNTLL